ncbi:MAG: lipopolysaccharide transport periplasmic protein LptA [Pseudomonadota bacterium]|nr:lipopolysaccharide transport periplasmic protein LptA [Pseudomonadota bacterium]
MLKRIIALTKTFIKALTKLLLGGLTAGFFMMSIAHGAPNPALSGEITIEADTAEFSQQTGVASYSGNVVIQQDDLTLYAEKVDIYQEDGKLVKAIASGSPAKAVRKAQADTPITTASASIVHYLVRDQKIALQGNAKLVQGDNKLESGFIDYYLNQKRIFAKKDQNKRVKITLPPDTRALEGLE